MTLDRHYQPTTKPRGKATVAAGIPLASGFAHLSLRASTMAAKMLPVAAGFDPVTSAGGQKQCLRFCG
jgi:hypothetical protein